MTLYDCVRQYLPLLPPDQINLSDMEIAAGLKHRYVAFETYTLRDISMAVREARRGLVIAP